MDRDATAVEQARATVPCATFLQLDQRHLRQVRATFDAALVLWQSFGYFAPDDNDRVLVDIARLLRPGGRLLLDVYNPAYVERHQGRSTQARDPRRTAVTNRLDGSRLISTIEYRDGSEESMAWELFSPDGLAERAASVGFPGDRAMHMVGRGPGAHRSRTALPARARNRLTGPASPAARRPRTWICPERRTVSPSGISAMTAVGCGTLRWVHELPFRPEPVEVLLFDLGGVVVDIDFRRCFARWARSAGCDVEEIASRFSIDAAYEEHERGRLPISGYLEHVRRMLPGALSDDELLAGWNDIWIGANEDVGPLLALASDAVPLYAFTNSNQTHQAVWLQRFAEPLGIFISVFVSSEIGHRKPDRSAFEHVASMIGASPESILFFDDGPDNVVGARDAGMQAVHVTSADSVRTALARLGAT